MNDKKVDKIICYIVCNINHNSLSAASRSLLTPLGFRLSAASRSLLTPLGFRLAVAAFASWERKRSRAAHCSRRSAFASLPRHSPHGNASIPAWLIARAKKGPPPAVMNPLSQFYFVNNIIISLLLATNLLMASGSRGACCRSAKS